MFVLASLLKNMKKHMRRLNKCNGNVFVKSKFLNTKLERFQRSLDKDPLNVLLREEEMIYLKAYSDAVPDEKRLMKVGLARAGLKLCLMMLAIPSMWMRFPLSLWNTLRTSFVICLVLDEEIKAAMFGIKYDKAAGLDGFTSKFLKKAWAIVGPDVCCVVREFFTS
ncbi:hypothetical protein Tco_0022431 [Tanacetum coccineum]